MSRKENGLLLEDSADLSLLSGKEVIVGFSGGADSAALLNLLWEAGAPVLAAHLNHGLRGEESDRDEAFVRGFCEERGIPLQVRKRDIGALARERGLGLEECGREERYAFFEELCRECSEGAQIATAHTLSDNLETMLFRLARGTSLEGLCGIPKSRGRIIRPLLSCTRRQVEEYCSRKGIDFVTDSTNSDEAYARNRIRAEVIPAFFEINPAAERNAGRLIQSLCMDREFLFGEAEKLLAAAKDESGRGLRLSVLQKAHGSLITRAAGGFLKEAGIPFDHAVLSGTEAIVRAGKGSVNLSGGRKLRAAAGFLKIEAEGEETPFFSEAVVDENGAIRAEMTLPVGEILRFAVQSAEEMGFPKKIYKNDLIFCVNYDTIIGKLLFRNRLPGDRFGFPGRQGRRLLKKLYSEMGLTFHQRSEALVLADDEGILWAEHLGVSERGKPGSETKRILVSYRENDPKGEA